MPSTPALSARAGSIRAELATVPEIAHFDLDRAALRIAERRPLVAPIADNGRYQISAIVPGRTDITYCDDLEVARATLAPFIAAHREDANAQAGIFDFHACRTVDSFRGGQCFGPRDTRHPLERIFGRLIAKGDPVTLIDPRGIRSFGGDRA